MTEGYVALVCARSGSKGLPGKNLRRLGGKSLVTWSIEAALAVPRVSQVIVSTDSEEIAAVARESGADVPFLRPGELATDNAPEWLVWRHALEHLEATQSGVPKGLIVVPPTAPLRTSEDLERCLDEFERGDGEPVVTVTDAHRSPFFNMVTISESGLATLVIPPSDRISRRQDAPVVYDMTTVAYVVSPRSIKERGGIMDGPVRAVYIPPVRAIDIDNELDFSFAEHVMAKGLGAGA